MRRKLILKAAIVGLYLLIGAAGFFISAQVDLHRDTQSEIMNSWNQSVTIAVFDDTIAAGDTVESAAISITGIAWGRPQYYCAVVAMDTFGGHSSPGFDADFLVKCAWVKDSIGHAITIAESPWVPNYDASEQFIATAWNAPDSCLFPLTVYGCDSLKYRLWATDSCIVRFWHWQVN